MTDAPAPSPIPEAQGDDFEAIRAAIDQSRPLVLRGLVGHWPAVGAARESDEALAAYLKRFERGIAVETLSAGPDVRGRLFYRDDMRGLNFGRSSLRISGVLDALLRHRDDAPPPAIAVQAVEAAAVLSGFEKENCIEAMPSLPEPRLWLGNAVQVAPHIDLNENIACVVAGRRRFVLFPPEQLPNLYVGPFDYSPAGAPVSMVSLEEPDFERYPRFRDALAAAFTAELGPGDAIYIPYLWWHGVQSLAPVNLLANYWWNDARPIAGSPYDVLMHALLVLGQMPAAHREAWRAMFDNYVFHANGDPLAHLPPHAHGALGGVDAEGAAQIKAHLARALSRG